MVASWAIAVLVALYTVIALSQARRGYRRGGVSIVGLSKLCSLFTIGVVTATTVSREGGWGCGGSASEAVAVKGRSRF